MREAWNIYFFFFFLETEWQATPRFLGHCQEISQENLDICWVKNLFKWFIFFTLQKVILMHSS